MNLQSRSQPLYRHLAPVARWLLNILPPAQREAVRFELQMAIVQWRSRRLITEFAHARDLRINLGAGDSGHAGWINVDAFPAAGITHVLDLRRPLPFPDHSAQSIFTEHFLEHLDYASEAPKLLAEIFRVLQPGGTVRVIVPDAGKYLHTYAQGSWEALAQLRPLLDGHRDSYWPNQPFGTRMELINRVFRQEGEHKFAYDAETLMLSLERAGFIDIRRDECPRHVPEDRLIAGNRDANGIQGLCCSAWPSLQLARGDGGGSWLTRRTCGRVDGTHGPKDQRKLVLGAIVIGWGPWFTCGRAIRLEAPKGHKECGNS